MTVQNIITERRVVLDTETTGMPVTDGHRVIEIGCVELIGRRLTGRHFHVYLQPDRESDEGAIGVHGITDQFLIGKPRFAEVADEFFEFVKGAQLIIHNAAFDVGFLKDVDNSGRELHGALLDSEILAEVYLAMTGGQTTLSLAGNNDGEGGADRPSEIRRIANRTPGRIIVASEAELAEHEARLAVIAKSAGAPALWTQLLEAQVQARAEA
ncbi:DNA polymerase III subunit epsilon [Pseudomonas sp. NZIPFR-PS5]|nr:DNA polymerase III subunit epsilon [Pseudomonas sp. NZIPFR-PS5]